MIDVYIHIKFTRPAQTDLHVDMQILLTQRSTLFHLYFFVAFLDFSHTSSVINLASDAFGLKTTTLTLCHTCASLTVLWTLSADFHHSGCFAFDNNSSDIRIQAHGTAMLVRSSSMMRHAAFPSTRTSEHYIFGTIKADVCPCR